MKKAGVIYSEGSHRWLAITRDPERPDYLIDTNEYLIAHDGHAVLCDPGGTEIFPAVFSAVSEQFDPRQIETIFASHQDPDIISSLALWLEFNPRIKCHVSWLWASFIPHFGGNADTFVAIPDGGAKLAVGAATLEAVPAHYLHSSGNFHLYDPLARILFSGDVGAALLPPGEDELVVKNFDAHIKHAEGFHRRWMGSNRAKLDWCERVSRMDIDMLCPQHGAIYQGEDVRRFIDWFAELEVGVLST
ncbi:MAG TPA: MBL fold metallo-hydrolase [Rhodocyclaceae bacterium]|nr:MBL fold metallo-hydrolase [Rhodocyclaceae bacterium]HMV53416.1 MBL fold metallo-hydrolase [Rhodocyclaceae bacterium]HMZ83093.1 MBL fold metallo-hydrolase [Rhodocyclaceae bacterium]HNA02674.1 MBL fold metallo-hydrolase [Rhodocyclaceae bacterium]HNB77759.1 MBL fold metallo-hydrolase [Rhodocyclaceae bacterium]